MLLKQGLNILFEEEFLNSLMQLKLRSEYTEKSFDVSWHT